MSKELPYFKFIVTDWLTGDIILEELDVQGLFINICALYWRKSGNLNINEINRRYPNKATALKVLTDRFISVNDGILCINFLNEQLHEREQKSVINSKNGSLGGRPKVLKTQGEKPNGKRNKATDNPSESESKPTKNKNKNKEEEKDIYEGFDFSPSFLIELEKWFKYRGEIKKPYNSPEAITAFLEKAKKMGEVEFTKQAKHSMSNQYQGLIKDKDDKQAPSPHKNGININEEWN